MSIVGIYNLALVPLGVDRVMDPAEESEQARRCNELFPYIRDEELSFHPWNFAIARVACALTTDTPLYDYTYIYQIPTDCLRVLSIYTYDDAFKREGDKIYTDVSPLWIRYIKQITDCSLFSMAFQSVVAARLKYELCFSLTGSKTMTLELYQALERVRKRAYAVDGQEGTPDNPFADRAVDCREGAVR